MLRQRQRGGVGGVGFNFILQGIAAGSSQMLRYSILALMLGRRYNICKSTRHLFPGTAYVFCRKNTFQ